MTYVSSLPLSKVLWACFMQNYYLDQSNAEVRMAPVRFSPLTRRLAEHVWQSFPSYQQSGILKEVLVAEWHDQRSQPEEDTSDDQ